ncbi:MAG: guanylate kinase [Oscillospiraceae bacterium]|jgi:guanylate kinase|nr:guanylate kinase [Oscillospiraceae bacterium]
MTGLLVVVSGPSGAGKSTVLKTVMEKRSDMFFSVSATTRSPRPEEVEGKDYFFMGFEAFHKLRLEGRFLEWTQYAGHCYGTLYDPVMKRLNNGETVVLDIETNGATQVMERYPAAVSIFLTPPSEAEAERRLRSRGTESEETICNRLEVTRGCFRYIDRYQYIVINEIIEETAKTLEAILTAERARTGRNPGLFADFRKQRID